MLKQIATVFAASALASAAWTSNASADSFFEAVPTAWRLQDYLNGGVTVYYTPSTCSSGQIILSPSTATTDMMNRFWSLILTARVSGLTIGVYYNPSTCLVTSFYLKE
jgi:hypothetical protein